MSPDPLRRRVTANTGKYATGDDRPASYGIRLPKDWCRRNEWPEWVLITEDRDGSLRIEPEKRV